MRQKLIAITLLLAVSATLLAAPKPVAPATLAHASALFLAGLANDGKRTVTYRAMARSTYFFLEEPAGAPVPDRQGKGLTTQISSPRVLDPRRAPAPARGPCENRPATRRVPAEVSQIGQTPCSRNGKVSAWRDAPSRPLTVTGRPPPTSPRRGSSLWGARSERG